MTSRGHKPRSASSGCRTSWRPGWRTASSVVVAVLLLAGCGGKAQPKLAHTDGAPLIALTGRIAGEGPCGQARDIPLLGRRAVSLIDAHRVPAALQEPFLSGVNDLVAQVPRCTPGERRKDTVAPRIETGHIEPVPHSNHPAQEARNLRAWLSAWSR